MQEETDFQESIQRNFGALKSGVKMSTISDFLIEKGVLQMAEWKNLKSSEMGEDERTEKFLFDLCEKTVNEFRIFIEALRKSSHDKLATKLENAYSTKSKKRVQEEHPNNPQGLLHKEQLYIQAQVAVDTQKREKGEETALQSIHVQGMRRMVEKAAEEQRKMVEKAEEQRKMLEKAAEEQRKMLEKAEEEQRKMLEKAEEEQRKMVEKAAEEQRKMAEKAAEEQRKMAAVIERMDMRLMKGAEEQEKTSEMLQYIEHEMGKLRKEVKSKTEENVQLTEENELLKIEIEEQRKQIDAARLELEQVLKLRESDQIKNDELAEKFRELQKEKKKKAKAK